MDFRFGRTYKPLEEDFSDENQNTIRQILQNKGLPNYKQKWRNANRRGTRKSALHGPNIRPSTRLNEGGPENNKSVPEESPSIAFANIRREVIPKNLYNRNQRTRKGKMRRNPKYNNLIANRGNNVVVSRVVPSRVEETHPPENYTRAMANENFYEENTLNFRSKTRKALRPNLVKTKHIFNMVAEGENERNALAMYRQNVPRSETISRIYAAALENQTPEMAIRILEDAKQTTRNNTKKRNIQTAIHRIQRNFPENVEY